MATKHITNHTKRHLCHAEKKVITLLDSSETRNRSATYQTHIHWTTEGVTLNAGGKRVAVDPMILVSLVGKGLLKIKMGKVSLRLVIYKRSIRALRADGYFDDVEP